MLDLSTPQGEAAQADFSIDDYGKADDGPYQIVMPSYPAPKWLNRYVDLGKALRECKTLCTLQGRPFGVVRWGREGSGANGGVPCRACQKQTRDPSFPRRVARPCRTCNGGLSGLGDLSGCGCDGLSCCPIAEFKPDGQQIVYGPSGAQLVGKPNYVVSHTPFPRFYKPEVYPQRYLEAVRTGQYLATHSGKRVFICSGFGAKCATGRDGKVTGVPVVYVEPGGLAKRYPGNPTGTVMVNAVSPAYFRELVEESRGGSFLGQGA